MPEMWRLFIAIPLPDVVVSYLRAIQENLRQQAPARTVRWVAPEGIHLTLKFLGDVPLTHAGDIEGALVEAARAHDGFALSIGGLGCFPNPNRPRVLWAGIEGERHALAALRDDVERQVAPLGYPTEDRPFSPHLTLGRIRPEASRTDAATVGSLLGHVTVGTAHTWRVGHVSLMRSELSPRGAIYSELARAPLRGA